MGSTGMLILRFELICLIKLLNGFMNRYYGEAFKSRDIEIGGGLEYMCLSYFRGLSWVMQYYYKV